MNVLQLKNWSERQQVLAIILLAGVITFLLWLFLLTPLFRRADRLAKEIDRMRAQLAQKNYLLGEDVLQQKIAEEQECNRRLIEEWASMASRLATFTNQEEAVVSDGELIIDYKVALFDVRDRLRRKSESLKISLPFDLGMDEEVRSDEDARKLMLQLKTVEKLVDTSLDLKIGMLGRIEPMSPVKHQGKAGGAAYLEEYPVYVEFTGTLQNLFDLFQTILDPSHVFVLRQLRVESAPQRKPETVAIKAVISALVFLEAPGNLVTAAARPSTGPSVPLGH